MDKTIASAAITQHDAVINRGSTMGKNVEERARKAHEGVVDAALSVNRQGRNGHHTIGLSRKAYENNGKVIAQETEQTPKAEADRAKIKVNKTESKVKDESLQSVKDASATTSKSADKLADTVKKGVSKSRDGAVNSTKDF